VRLKKILRSASVGNWCASFICVAQNSARHRLASLQAIIAQQRALIKHHNSYGAYVEATSAQYIHQPCGFIAVLLSHLGFWFFARICSVRHAIHLNPMMK
jgi:hypothetical protein